MLPDMLIADEANLRLVPERLATPYFEIDTEILEATLHSFRKALPQVRPFYAVKANPEPVVLKTLAGLGVGFEVASVHELRLVQGVGIDAGRVLFGTAVKPAADVRAAYEAGVRRFVADSYAEIDKIADSAPTCDLLLRVRVDDSESVFPFGEKFGAEAEALEGLARRAGARGLQVVGLSFHVGSQSTRVNAWEQALDAVSRAFEVLQNAGFPVTIIDIGGGFPAQYDSPFLVPRIDEIGTSIARAARNLPAGIDLIAEPGRFLVAKSASLVVSVVARVERAGQRWLFLDAGCYNGLFEAMAYQGRTRYPVLALGLASESLVPFALAGPTGDSADVIGRSIPLPHEIGVGDRLRFSMVGAYTMSLSVPFNGFPRPAIYVL